ncbi:hypothetical protein HNR44_003155 [Geomicrobium halophilum]|uniref:Probable membrane transporter protein n=1 Tax=Geomicrobium halophilum TaxID=549000 RepID=A0A841PX35_9BACL|nr:sulfite exporter TauE/SafE family protein [Geomicrobium halophilum]MBB6451161.1 hypothetical protein [Geomicrobium halophilum]
MPWDVVLIFVIVFIGAFVQGASGFGVGLVVMGFLPMFLTVIESTLLALSLLMVTALTILFKYYKFVHFNGMISFIMSSFAARILSFFILTNYGEMDFLQMWLGFFLIAIVIYLLVSNKVKPRAERIHFFIPILLGIMNGFFGGLFAVGGTFLVIYFLLVYKNDKYRYTANVQAVTVMTSAFSLLLHGVSGDFTSTFPLYFAVGIAAVLLGANLGMKWFAKLPTQMIRRFAMTLVCLAALNLIVFS